MPFLSRSTHGLEAHVTIMACDWERFRRTFTFEITLTPTLSHAYMGEGARESSLHRKRHFQPHAIRGCFDMRLVHRRGEQHRFARLQHDRLFQIRHADFGTAF